MWSGSRGIRDLQSRGLSLAEIGRVLGDKGSKEELPTPEIWENYRLAEDVIVIDKSGICTLAREAHYGLYQGIVGPEESEVIRMPGDDGSE